MKRAILLIGLWLVGISVVKAQCVAGNCKDGKGTYIYKDKTVYEGEFKKTKAHGYGVCYYSNGNSYEGEWANHTFHGKGIMRYKNGKVKAGLWKNGKFVKTLNINTIAPPRSMAYHDKLEDGKAIENPTRIWAVVVGVAAYSHMPSLNFTDDDAYRMFAFFKSPEGGALPDSQIKIIVDEGATRKNILKMMRSTFSQADTNDVILFYFSGHGLQNAFLPIDYDGHLNRLKHNEIKKIFAESNAKYKICIADACHSGSFQGEQMVKGTSNSTIQKYYDAFNRSQGGTALILSSKAEEVSIENAGLRQGIFTHFLIRGLKGLADKDKDMIVTVVELFEYVKDSVKFYTGNYQTPVLYGEFDKKMPISVVRE